MKSEVTVNPVYSLDMEIYRNALYKLKIPVLLMDKEGRFVYANRATLLLTGYSSAEILDMSFSDLFVEDTKKITVEYLKEKVRLECKVNIKHQENAIIVANIKAYGIRPNENREHYFQIILRDLYLADDNYSGLKKKMSSLLDKLKEFNDDLEERLG